MVLLFSRPFLFKIEGTNQEKKMLDLVLVGTDTLGSLLRGSLDGLLGGEDSGNAGKSGLFETRKSSER